MFFRSVEFPHILLEFYIILLNMIDVSDHWEWFFDMGHKNRKMLNPKDFSY